MEKMDFCDAKIAAICAQAYTREFVREEDGSWFAKIAEWPGCMTVGDTLDEAATMLDDAMHAWVKTGLQSGDAIPEPLKSSAFSGRFVVRVGKSLHRDLARAAEREGVSLNAFVTSQLSRSVGSNGRR